MPTTQYIGSRYVPLFADPVEWSSEKSYEPLTIVSNEGNSYTSKQFVPVGVDINNTEFWALTGNYNAQVEQYRREVQAFDGRIVQLENFAEYGLCIVPSVAEMKLFENIGIAPIIETEGYYSPGDGGAGLYIITDDTSYTPNDIDIINCLENMTAILLTDADVNAASFGCVGNNATEQRINRALEVAQALNKKIIFPVNFTTNSSISIKSNVNVEISKTLEYTGTDAAIIFDDCEFSTVKANKIIAESGIGVKFYQHDPNTNVKYCTLDCLYIKANTGIYLAANTRGIIESNINVVEIDAYNDCIKGECLQSGVSVSTFIGQISININHAKATHGYGVVFNAYATNEENKTGVITVVNFGDVSFENSYGGVYLNGNIHDVRFNSIRTVEQDSFDKIIKLSGAVSECIFNIASDIYTSKIDNQCTVLMPIANKIIGALTSSSGFRMDGEIILYKERTVIKPSYSAVVINNQTRLTKFCDDATGAASINWRAFERIENSSNSAPINYTLNNNDLRFFDPAGVSKILINNHKASGPITLTLDDTVIFDGTAMDDGRHHYLLTVALQDASSVTNIIQVLKLD